MSDTPVVVKNAKQSPTVMYGLHFVDGLAQYDEPDRSFKVFLNEKTLASMDPTFQGCPVYVGHVDSVDLKNLQQEADGYVIRSFRNDADGKHWVEFLVVSDKAREAIQRGWKLSNAYVAESFGPGGTWNGINYDREIIKGKFEHLAIVPDPRYAESIILDGQQFRDYNSTLMSERTRLMNSETTVTTNETPGIIKQMGKLTNLFKRTPIEDTKSFEDAVVSIDGKDMSFEEVIKVATSKLKNESTESQPTPVAGGGRMANDEEHAEHKAAEDKKGEKESGEEKEKQGMKEEEKGAPPQMADMDHHVTVNGESKPLHQFMKDYMNMHAMHCSLAEHYGKMANLKSSEEDGGEKDAAEAQKADLTKRNADEDGGEKEATEQLKESDKTHRNEAGKKNFEKLANAEQTASQPGQFDLDTWINGTDRGRSRYGSGK